MDEEQGLQGGLVHHGVGALFVLLTLACAGAPSEGPGPAAKELPIAEHLPEAKVCFEGQKTQEDQWVLALERAGTNVTGRLVVAAFEGGLPDPKAKLAEVLPVDATVDGTKVTGTVGSADGASFVFDLTDGLGLLRRGKDEVLLSQGSCKVLSLGDAWTVTMP